MVTSRITVKFLERFHKFVRKAGKGNNHPGLAQGPRCFRLISSLVSTGFVSVAAFGYWCA